MKPNLDPDRDSGIVLVAVFHGVHRRLGHGRLEPRQTLFGKGQILYRLGDLFHGRAFVPRLAWKCKVGEDSKVYITSFRIWLKWGLEISHSGPGSLQCDQGNVVLLLRVLSREAGQFGQHKVDELLAAIRTLGHDQLPEAWETEHLAFGIVGLHQPITVEEEVVPRHEYGFFLLVWHLRHQAERHPSRHQLLC